MTKWANMPDGTTVRIDEAEDGLFKTLWYDFSEKILPGMIIKRMKKGVVENKQASQTALINFSKKTQENENYWRRKYEKVVQVQSRHGLRMAFYRKAAILMGVLILLGVLMGTQ